MTAPLSGLTGLAGQQRTIEQDPQATPEERYGGPADPRHGQWGEQAAPYPWESSLGMGGSHGPYGPENQLLGDEQWFWEPAGMESEDPTFDLTPGTHGGPSPVVLSGPIDSGPNATASTRQQSAQLHGLRTNAGLRAMFPPQALGIQQDEWNEIAVTDPGNSDLVPLPKQAISSGFMFGTRDRTQSMARQNEFGFDAHHRQRRYASGPIPGNTMWLKPGGRPLVKNLAGPARPPVGPSSPFAGDDLGTSFAIQGAYLQNTPVEYEPPAQVNLAPNPAAYVSGDDATIEWY